MDDRGDVLSNTGIVDQNVQPTVFSNCPVEELGHPTTSGDIQTGWLHIQTLLPQLLGRCLCIFQSDVTHDHPGAVAGKLLSDPQAQPLGRSGHHRN